MREILDGVFHWSRFHERIRQQVHSTYLAATVPPVLIDPMAADVDPAWFEGREPRHVYLTNRHHFRGTAGWTETFGCDVRCHHAGLHEFDGGGFEVDGFDDGDQLPGGIRAHEIGALCPEETALHVPLHGGILALGDAVIRDGEALAFVPDQLMGDDPDSVKRGLRESLRRLPELDFDTLVMAHGEPWVGGAREALRRFVEAGA